MRKSYNKLYVHYVWGTWKRKSLIDEQIEPILKSLIEDKIREQRCHLLAFGCTSDHVHLLVRLHQTVCVSSLVKEIKGYTSFTIANQIWPDCGLRWQGGYGALTVSAAEVNRLIIYIQNQKTHHASGVINKWGMYEPPSGGLS